MTDNLMRATDLATIANGILVISVSILIIAGALNKLANRKNRRTKFAK